MLQFKHKLSFTLKITLTQISVPGIVNKHNNIETASISDVSRTEAINGHHGG